MSKEQHTPIPEEAGNSHQEVNFSDTALQDATVVTSDEENAKPKTKAKRPRKPVEQVKEEAPEPIAEKPEVEEVTVDYDACSKEELVEHICEIVKNSNVDAIKSKVALIKVAFYKIIHKEKQKRLEQFIDDGGAKEDYVPVVDVAEEKFNEAFKIYKTMKVRFDTENERVKEENLVVKQKILEELRALIDSEEKLKKTYDSFKLLQERWKETGQVPKAEVSNLWQTYHFLVEKFFDKVKINNELKNLDLKKNLELKIELCEKTEELFLEPSIDNAFKELQKNHEKWREIGPVPQEKKDEIWERFRAITEKLNLRRQEYFKNREAELEKNYTDKIALCERVEKLASAGTGTFVKWNDLAEQVKQLEVEWKKIGTVPKKYNDEIWARFRAGINLFFDNRKKYFGERKGEQVENLNIKENLCVQAEALSKNDSWSRTTDEFIRLQREWKNTGPVPPKHTEKIWARFRAACDEFFNRKAEYYKNIGSHEEDNMKLKEALIEKVNAFEPLEDKKANLQAIKDFQREFMDIGFVPVKEKENIQNKFRAAIDKQFDKMKLNPVEKSTFSYKMKMESVMSSPDADFLVRKERTNIVSRLDILRNDIKLWENNIGFFAKSKNADGLRKEFEDKISSAKEDVKILEAKLKLLRKE